MAEIINTKGIKLPSSWSAEPEQPEPKIPDITGIDFGRPDEKPYQLMSASLPAPVVPDQEVQQENDYAGLFKSGLTSLAYQHRYRQAVLLGVIPAEVSSTGKEITLSQKQQLDFSRQYPTTQDFNQTLKMRGMVIDPGEPVSTLQTALDSFKVGYEGYKQGIAQFNDAVGFADSDEQVDMAVREQNLQRWQKGIQGHSGWVTQPFQVAGNMAALAKNAIFQDIGRTAEHVVPAVVTRGRSLKYTLKAAVGMDVTRSVMGGVYREARDTALAQGVSNSEADQIAFDLMMSYGVANGLIEAGGTTIGLSFLSGAFKGVTREILKNKVKDVEQITRAQITKQIIQRNAKNAAAFTGEETVTEVTGALLQERVNQLAAEQAGGEYTPAYLDAAVETAKATLQGTLPFGGAIGGIGTGVSLYRTPRDSAQPSTQPNTTAIKQQAEQAETQMRETATTLADTIEANPDLIATPEAIEETKTMVRENMSQIPSPYINAAVLEETVRTDPDTMNNILDVIGIDENEFYNAIFDGRDISLSWDAFIDLFAAEPSLAKKVISDLTAVPQSMLDAVDIYAENKRQAAELDTKYIDSIYQKLADTGVDADGSYNLAVTLNSMFKSLEFRSDGAFNRETNLANFVIQRNNKRKKDRGSFKFEDGKAVITLFQQGDASTVLHEAAHYFRAMMQEVADITGNPEIIADLGAMKGFAGVKTTWQRRHEEKIAEGFENYILTGKAPTPALKSVFAYLKDALIKIYEKIKPSFPELNNEITAVFDRMLDTDAHAREFKEQMRGFTFPPDTPAETISNFNRVTEQAAQDIDQQIMTQQGQDIINLTPEFNALAEQEALDSPRRRIKEQIKEIGGLNAVIMEGQYGQAVVDQINADHPGVITENGIAFDEVAERLGMDWEDMISSIQATLPLADDIKVREAQIETEYSDDNPPIAMSEADIERSNIIVDTLEKDLGEQSSLYEAKAAAVNYENALDTRDADSITEEYEQIRAKIVTLEKEVSDASRESSEELYQRKSNKQIEALKDRVAQEKTKRKDQKQKFLLERARLLRDYKYRMKALSARIQFINKFKNKASRLMRSKPAALYTATGIPAPTLEQIKYMLVNAGASSARVTEPEVSLRTFIDNQKAKGLTSIVSDWVANADYPKRGDRKTTYRSWQYAELKEFSDSIDNLVKMGREEQFASAEINKASVAKINQEINTTALKSIPKRLDNSVSALNNRIPFLDTLNSFFAQLLKVETVTRRLDGTSDKNAIDGPVYRNVFKPMADAYDKQLQLMEEINTRVLAAFEKLPAEMKKNWRRSTFSKISDQIGIGFLPADSSWRTTKYNIDGAPYALTREEMIVVALNSGNQGNIDALIEGNQFTEEGIQNVWDALNPEEIQLVKDLWAAIDPLYTPLAQVVFESTGVRLERVQPKPVNTKIGVLDGGYFPMVFNRSVPGGIQDVIQNDSETMDILLASANMKMSKKSNASHNRTGGKFPLLLNMGVLDKHITDTIHDITHRIPAKKVRQIILSKEFRKTVADTMGDQYNRQVFEPWLSWVVNPKYTPTAGMEALVETFRRNATIATMGYKVSVALMQLSGLFQSIDTIGSKWMLEGLREKLSGRNISAHIDSISPSMAERRKGVPADRDLQEALGHGININNPSALAKFNEKAFWFIGKMDMFIADATFMGAYEKALSEGRTETQAAEMANQVIRTTQPLGAPLTAAAIQHGGVAARLFTMYYTFFSGLHNRLWLRYNQAFTDKSISYTDFMTTAMWTLILPSIFDWMVGARELPDEADDWLEIGGGVLSYSVAGIPIIRDLANGILTDYAWRGSPISATGEALVKTIDRVTDLKFDDTTALSAFKTIGFMFGLPGTQQISATYRGLKEVDINEPASYLNPVLGPVY